MFTLFVYTLGVCHVYIDNQADVEKALKIVKDSKTDYPSACNAMETLLFHQDLVDSTFFHQVCQMLRAEGVQVYSGPKIRPNMTFPPELAKKLKHEYGGLACTIEVVRDVNEAIEHIHRFGSGHTDVIITEDKANEKAFLEGVDSACVFSNCSSRMADGFRLGLGIKNQILHFLNSNPYTVL